MRGCSKTRKKYLGGSTYNHLAYTGDTTPSMSNPNMVPTQLLHKGGFGGGLSIPTTNTNASNPYYPNTGPPLKQEGNIFNNASHHVGGRNRKGGGEGCGPLCNTGLMVGGVRHRHGCKCSKCRNHTMKGGNTKGFVGSPWTPTSSGNQNYYENNTYNNDISRQMVNVGANPPFLKGGKRKYTHKQKQKGGSLSNFMTQDLINLGRQFQFGIGSAYNALSGYSGPTNPLPWKDQFPNRPSINSSLI